MTGDKDLTQLLGYIGEVRDALRMQNWDVQLHREACEDHGAWAETWHIDNHWMINIRVNPRLFTQDPETIRNTVVHELVHAQHREVTLWWEGCILNNDDIAVSQGKSWDGDFKMHMERFVSWTTSQIEECVPLPSLTRRYKVPKGVRLLPENSSASD